MNYRAAALVAFCFAISPPQIANAQDAARCFADANDTYWKEALDSCTAVIKERTRYTASQLVTAFGRRGDYHLRPASSSSGDNYERAVEDFTQLIALDTSPLVKAAAYWARAYSYALLGRSANAIPDAKEAMRLDPSDRQKSPLRGYFRGLQLLEGNDLEGALKEFNKFIESNAQGNYGDSEWSQPYGIQNAIRAGHAARAETYKRLLKFDEAISDINKAMGEENNARYTSQYVDNRLLAERGDIFRAKGDLKLAIDDLTMAVSRDDLNPNVYSKRGDINRYAGDFKAALSDYDFALFIYNRHRDRSPKDEYIPALTGLGLTYERQGASERAKDAFQRAVTSESADRAFGQNAVARRTAEARLAALNSGAPQPVIPAAPIKATKPDSIPTPQIVIPPQPVPAPAPPQKSNAPIKAEPPPVEKPTGNRRVALVIGNSKYQRVTQLPNPQNDAEAIAATFKKIGFDSVSVVLNATAEGMLGAIKTFSDEASKADWAVVYYAGHGIEVGGINYLVPVDAQLATEQNVERETVPLPALLRSADTAKKIKLIILDACRDNPFPVRTAALTPAPATAKSDTGLSRSLATRSTNGRGLAEIKVQGATLVVYAAKDGEKALDGDGRNSPFAVAMAQRLTTPGVEINKIFRLVRDDVMEATAGRQEPYTYGSLPGREDFFFVNK